MRIKAYKYKILVLLTIVTNSTILWAQGNAGMPSIPGKCYAKCLTPEIYESWEECYPIYTGEFHDTLDFVDIIDISLDNEDVYDIQIVTDTTLTDEFVWETFYFKELIEESGSKWKETICDNDLTKKKIKQISHKLFEIGYLNIKYVDENIDENDKSAMRKFQIDNNLPIGQFDIETLESLGIR